MTKTRNTMEKYRHCGGQEELHHCSQKSQSWPNYFHMCFVQFLADSMTMHFAHVSVLDFWSVATSRSLCLVELLECV